MKVLVQSLRTGVAAVAEAPDPAGGHADVVVRSAASLVSAGTERMLIEFGRASWLDKARQQPDKVRQVLAKALRDGVGPTLDAVRSKLEEPIAPGYCNAGVVVTVGAGVSGFVPGDRVVTNGPHAEVVAVPHTLAARIPESVSFEHAASAPVAAIGLQGLRLARPTLGETVVVYGLGLIGLLTVQLARAHGCRVLGIDRDESRLGLGARFGAQPVPADGNQVAAVLAATGGVGADAVLLTLASDSDDPVHLAAEMSRKRGRLVLVGVTGLRLQRDDFYRKELSFQVSCSYGPGRYDPEHEEKGHDYPLPYVRWTERRNFEAVLGLMAEGKVDPAPLLTHRFPFEEAPRAYDLITSREPHLGVILTYSRDGGEPLATRRTIQFAGPRHGAISTPSVGVLGAGAFATRVLIPGLAATGMRLRAIASSGGTHAAVAARRFGFELATSDPDAVLANAEVDAVVIATRHDSHARLALRALEAGKHVFVEKPLALAESDLPPIEVALERTGRILTVGFNRRFAPLAVALQRRIRGRGGPLALVVTVNAGSMPPGHWTLDPAAGGGRIVGEACHFIDLARYLAGAPITSLDVVAAADPRGTPVEDVAHLTLGFADGSTAAIHYLSNGSGRFPKERIEAFWDGRVAAIDNWRRLRGWGVPALGTSLLPGRQDKGHRAEVAAFARAVREGGPPPIPHAELFEVSRWAIRAAALARRHVPV